MQRPLTSVWDRKTESGHTMPPDTVDSMNTKMGWLNCLPKRYLPTKATPKVETEHTTTTISTVKCVRVIKWTIVGIRHAIMTLEHILALFGEKAGKYR
jgi:hypothetical protein